MSKKRRTFSAREKSKIAIEAIRERETSSEIAKRYSVHPNQVSIWKKLALEGLDLIFEDRRIRKFAVDRGIVQPDRPASNGIEVA
jgi:transposase